MDVVIYGHGAHSRDMAATFTGKRDRVLFFDDDPSKNTANGVKLRRNHRVLIGINDPAGRRAMADRYRRDLTGMDVSGRWTHPTARIGPEVETGQHTHINAGAFLTRCKLGRYVTVGPNATICGDVTIGDDVMIGAGAVIKNLLTIGDGAVIGCGAVVVADVPAGVTVVGNPARELVKSC